MIKRLIFLIKTLFITKNCGNCFYRYFFKEDFVFCDVDRVEGGRRRRIKDSDCCKKWEDR
jgi:hypothetical protein